MLLTAHGTGFQRRRDAAVQRNSRRSWWPKAFNSLLRRRKTRGKCARQETDTWGRRLPELFHASSQTIQQALGISRTATTFQGTSHAMCRASQLGSKPDRTRWHCYRPAKSAGLGNPYFGGNLQPQDTRRHTFVDCLDVGRFLSRVRRRILAQDNASSYSILDGNPPISKQLEANLERYHVRNMPGLEKSATSSRPSKK